MPKKDDKELKVVNVRLIDAPSLYSDEVLDSPEAVSKLIAKEFKTYDREVCAVINLNVKLKPININICSVGTLDTSLLNPREVFKSSILSNAASFMLVHNHPSGETTPSREDKALTKMLIQCGDLLNIKMIDHLIIGSGTGDVYSFKEEGLFETLSSNVSFDIRENRVMERNDNSEKYRIRDEINSVINHKMNRYDSVMICKDTPKILQDIGLENKPILMSQQHIRNCLHEKGRNPHWHGLNLEFFEKLPNLLSSPAMLMDSFSDDYSIITVFDVVDKDNLPIMASINTNGRGNYEFRAINSNYLTSVYGKENFDNFLKRTIEADFLLYANKEKTQTLSSCAKLQLLGAIPQSFRFDTIIHKSGNIVNDDKTMEVEKMSKKNEKENAKVKGSTKKVKENLKEKESKKEQTKENKKDITKEKVNAKEKEKETLEKEIQSLQEQIEDRQLDLHYADSFEQSGQIREDIQKMEAKLSSLEERLKKTVEKASEKENKNIKEKVYLNVHNNFAKIGLESKLGNGQTFNAVTIPKGSVVDGKDIGGGTIYPLDMYIYKNKFNDNLTTVQFRQDQEVQVNFKNGEHIKVKAEDLCKAVTKANKEYLDKNKNIEKSKIREKNKDNEMDI